MRTPGPDRHPETPADVVKVPRPESGNCLLLRRQVIARHQRHRWPREHPLAVEGTAGQQGGGEGEVIAGGRDEPAAPVLERRRRAPVPGRVVLDEELTGGVVALV